MYEFNVNEYFAARSKAFKTPEGSDFINEKYLELQRTSQDKVRELAERSSLAAQQEKLAAKSLISQWGMEPTSITGALVDSGASLYEGATRGVGSVLASVPSAVAGARQNSLSEDDIAALNRYQKGQATPADLERINTPQQVMKTIMGVNGPIQVIDGHDVRRTPLEAFKTMNAAREISRGIVESADNSELVHPVAKAEFSRALTQSYIKESPQIAKGWESLKSGDTLDGAADVTAGIAKLLFSASGDVLNNPKAVSQYILQNAPQLLVGLVGKAGALAQLTDNISSAATIYNKGILDYQGKHDGALPPESQRQSMALYSASHAGAEIVSDKIGLAATKLGGEGIKDAARASFKSALKGTSVAAGEGLLSEAPTEAYQQFAEGQITGKPATGAEIFAAGVIGGASGAGLSGGGRAIHEASKLIAQPNAPKVRQELTPDQAKIQDDAINSGDVSTLLNPDSKAYAPDLAIAALVGHSKLETTTEEQKQANQVKVDGIVANLESTRDQLKSVLTTSEEKQAELVDMQTARAEVDPTNTTRLAQYDAAIKAQEAEIAAPPLTKEEIRGYQAELSKTESWIEQARVSKEDLGRLVQTDDQINEHVATLLKPVDTTLDKDALAAGAARSAAAAVSVINLAMSAPDRLDPKMAIQIAENKDNGLTEPQRDYLRAFNESEVAINIAKTDGDVKSNIYQGTKPDPKTGEIKFLGIDQYRQKMADSITAGNPKKGLGLLYTLGKFAADHAMKAEVARDAIKIAPGTQILREKNEGGNTGRWFINKGKRLTDPERRNNGGLNVDSIGLVKNIELETKALEATHNELLAAYELKFNPTVQSTTGVSNVQVTPQNTIPSGSNSATQLQPKTDQAPAQTGNQSTPTSIGIANGQPTSVVGTDSQTGGITPSKEHQSAIDALKLIDEEKEALIKQGVSGKVATEIAGLKAQNRQLFESMQDRPEYGPDAEAAVGAKRAQPATKEVATTTPKQGPNYIPASNADKLRAAKQRDEDAIARLDSSVGLAESRLRGAERDLKDPIDPAHTWTSRESQETRRSNMADNLQKAKEARAAFVPEYPALLSIIQSESVEKTTNTEETNVSSVNTNRITELMYQTGNTVTTSQTKPKENNGTQTTETIKAEPQGQKETAGGSQTTGTTAQPIVDPTPVAQAAATPTSVASVVPEGPLPWETDEEYAARTNLADTTKAASEGVAEANAAEVVEASDKQEIQGLTALTVSTPKKELPPGTKLGNVYRTINKVVAFLTQKKVVVTADKDIDKDRPLVSIKNLLERWSNNDIDIADLFVGGLAEEELTALNTFKGFANKWVKIAKAGFVKGSINPAQNKKYLYEDPMQDFINADGTVDSNILTAVVYAGYTWLTETANRPAYLDEEEILKMHGQSKEGGVFVSPKGKAVLKTMATLETTAINSLGKLVVASLGLKARPNAPKDYLSKVTAAFGVHALLMLEKQGLINRGSINGTAINQYLPGIGIEPTGRAKAYTNSRGEYIEERDIYPDFLYVQLPRGDKLSLVGDTKTIRESSVKARDVLNRLMGSERSPMEASWVPIPFKQETAKGTDQGISRKQRRILEKAQKVPNRVIPDMWNALAVLGDKAVLIASGWKELDNSKIQKTNREGVETQNNNVENQLQRMKELVQGAIDSSPLGLMQPFFANFEVWRNFRVGTTTGNLNLQTSKIHRFMFGRPGWEATIKFSDTEAIVHFQVALAQALGIKIDKQSNLNTVALLNAHLKEDGNRTTELAIQLNKSIIDPKNNILSESDKAAIGELSAKTEGMQTLQALVAYGKYLAAVNGKKDSFTTTMLVGVDGKTNGPIFSILALGAAKSAKELYKFINKGGFFTGADGVNNYSEWYQKGTNQDLYEGLAQHLLINLPSGMETAMTAFQAITKELINKGKATSAGRGLVKTPLTSFAFGSSTTTSVENMKKVFVQAVVDRIQALANSEAKGVTEESLVTSINTLLTFGKVAKTELLPAKMSIESLMDLELSGKQELALTTAFDMLLGDTVDAGMKDYFPDFIRRRNSVNSNIQAAFSIYSAVYQDLRNTELNRQMDSGDIAFDVVTVKATKDVPAHQKRVPIHDMTVEQEKALRARVAAILPQAHTTFTTGTNELGSGVYMAKQATGISQSPMYQIKVQLGTPLTDNGIPVRTPKGNPVTHLLTRGVEKTERSPGVAGLPYMMHSLDSGVILDSFEDSSEDTEDSHAIAAFNGFDERAEGVHRVNQNARSINKATWVNMLRFSPATEAFQLLERSIVNVVALLKSGDISNEALLQMKEALYLKLPFKLRLETAPVDLVSVLLRTAMSEQFDANNIRLMALSQLAIIDQYTWEGGEYRVEEKDRAEAAQLLNEHRKQGKNLSAETLAAAKALGIALRDGVKTKQTPKVDEGTFEQSNKEEETRPVDPETSPFGDLVKKGEKPTHQSDPGIEKYLRDNPKATIGSLIRYLHTTLSAQSPGRQRDFRLELLDRLRLTTHRDLPVTLITAKTTEEEHQSMPPYEGAAGWFDMDGAGIFLLSSEFKDSYITEETLLHEMTHDALSSIVEFAERGKASVDTTRRVQELKGLWNAAKEYVAAQDKLNKNTKLSDKYAKQLENLQEFLAYGLTRTVFQAEILANMQVERKTGGLINGLSKFVETVMHILFKGTTKSQEAQRLSGLTSLITNTDGLFTEMEQGANEKTELEGQALKGIKDANFKKWFGDSKVVDENGDPLVVYHGTAADITAFDPKKLGTGTGHPTSKLGFYFSKSAKIAGMFTGNASNRGGTGSNILPVFLSIKNPKTISLAEFKKLGIDLVGTPFIGHNPVIQSIKDGGYDGLLILADKEDNGGEFREDSWVAFYPNQIKSVFNDGTYSDTGRILAMSAPQQEEIDAIHAYSTLDIHEALADPSQPLGAAWDSHLRGLLDGIVEKLHGPFGAFKEYMRKNEAGSPLDVWLKARDTGKAPYAATLDTGPIRHTAQESFVGAQIEATIRAALDANDAKTTIAYNDLSKLFDEKYRTMNHDGRDFYLGDWATATPTEQAQAKAEFDFMFELGTAQADKLNHLARFAALVLANQKVNKIFQTATERNTKQVAKATTWGAKLQAVLESILEYFHSRLMHTYQGQNADEKLNVLVERLVDMEARQKYKLAHQVESRVLGTTEAIVQKFSDTVRSTVNTVAGSNFIKTNKVAVVRATGSIARTIAGNRVDLFLENIRKMREQNFAGVQGLASSLLQEYVGQNKAYQVMLRLSKLIEGKRKDLITVNAKTAMEAFVDGGKNISDAARDSLTAVFLRSGAHNLMDHYSLAEIEHLVGDKAVRDDAITDFENQLKAFGSFSSYFTKQANILGIYKATGNAYRKFLVLNAYNISRMLGTPQANQITTARAAEAEKLIKPLIALYALRYSGSTDLLNAKEVIAAENARPPEADETEKMNGIEFILDLHKHLEADSLDRLFHGDPTQMIHGYTSEIYDPRVDVVTANTIEGKDLIAQGYKQGARLATDPADPNAEVQHIYSMKDGGLMRRVTGIFSYTGMRAKGNTIHNGYLNVNTVAGLSNAATNANILHDRIAEINDLFSPGPVPDLSNEKSTYMAPVFNRTGDIVKWRYLMQEDTKNDLLKRDNRFDKVLGTIAGSIYDKESTQEQNAKAVKALKDAYDMEQGTNPRGYILVGAKSTDPEMKEIWDLLPEETQRDIKKIWGYNGMRVKAEHLNIMFGYRKLSMATMFKKDPDAREAWEKLAVYMGEAFFGKKAGMRVTQGERIWQELVAEAKDIIVVKSGLIMLANIRSNMWLLHMSGVPLTDMFRHHLVALKGATAYQKDSVELDRLKVLRDTGYTQGKDAEIDRKILLLENEIVRNPVTRFINEGMLPTIMEDVDPENDRYSYKRLLTSKVESLTDKMNPGILSAVKYVYMAHDTPMYQGFRHLTQLSDFVARYTLYQHVMNRKDNPLSHEEAIQEASDAFVNYDIPMHRYIQYSDDMGLTMFTKYFLRIQKVLAKTLKENPARVLMGILAAQYLGLGSTVLEESSMWTKIGNNPIQDGPWKFFESLDELPAFNMLSVFEAGAAAPVVKVAAKVAGLPG